MMNKNKLTAIIHNVSKEKHVSFNVLLQVYFFERLLSRLASSKYKDSFILKGGFLLSSMLGITERSTIDMDFSVSNITFEKGSIEETIRSIIEIDLKDNVSFELKSITEIMERSSYIGYQVVLVGTLENIKVPFSIDLATGDPITPHEITYQYHSVLKDEVMEIKRYTVESVLAEKLQTIMDKKTGNSRMKDFYDIYILMKLHKNLFDPKILNDAIKNTFNYRNTAISKEDFILLLEVLVEDNEFNNRWINFVKKNYYVEDVDFKAVKSEIIELIEIID